MHFIFLFFIFFYFYQVGALLQPLILLLHIPNGFYSVPTMSVSALCALMLYFRAYNKKYVTRQLLDIVAIWSPWLIYLAFRCDFNDSYSVKKITLMSFAHFTTIFMICIAFFSDHEKFTKYFFWCTAFMVTIILCAFFVNPSISAEHSTSLYRRFTVGNINPISLSRTFAIGALTLQLWGRGPCWIKIIVCSPFVIGMLLTGSRGPIISLSAVLALYYLYTQKSHTWFALRFYFICTFVLISMWTVEANFEDTIDHFFNRGGSSKGMYVDSGRYQALIETFKEFTSEPVFGVGLAKYGKSDKHIIVVNEKSNGELKRLYPHNIFYEVLAELGIIGFVLFLLLFRPGKWMIDFSNKFIFLFLLCFSFSMTSGDFFDNIGVFIFGYIARFNKCDQGVCARQRE
jgi:O-antigen ligase